MFEFDEKRIGADAIRTMLKTIKANKHSKSYSAVRMLKYADNLDGGE